MDQVKTGWYENAKRKLETEQKPKGLGRAGAVMAPHVAKALVEFCRQSEDFARRVATGGSFEECMKAVEKNVGSSISDLQAYRRGVQFYAKGCDVRFRMEIVEADGAAPATPGGDASTGGKEQSAAETAPEKPRSAVLIDVTAFL